MYGGIIFATLVVAVAIPFLAFGGGEAVIGFVALFVAPIAALAIFDERHSDRQRIDPRWTGRAIDNSRDAAHDR